MQKQTQSTQALPNSIITLKQLQNRHLIPKIQLITLKTNKLQFKQHTQVEKKLLLITLNNTIGYTTLNHGIPEDSQGIVIFPDGAYYLGCISVGKLTGLGRLCNEFSMYSYEGQWQNGEPQGYGQENICGNVYQGQFKKGKKNGKGILQYADGSQFQGTFQQNKIIGFGKYSTPSFIWQGNWNDGYLEGQGTQIILNKHGYRQSMYLGNFQKGQREGVGKFVWDHTREYEGSFKRGQLDGSGIFTIGKKKFKGMWNQGTDLQIKQINNSITPSKIQFKRV